MIPFRDAQNHCEGSVFAIGGIRSLVPLLHFGFLDMPQVELIPHSWLSWDLSVVRDDSVVAEIEIPRWRKKGVLKVGGLHYAAYREGVIRGRLFWR